MTDTDRCEPPPEWRGRGGWHWVQGVNNYTGQVAEFPAYWTGTHEPMDHMWRAWGVVHEPSWCGWRYLAPVTPPATVAALVEALEGLMRWHLNEEAIYRMGLHPAPAKAAYEAARAALAAYREARR